MMYLTGYLPVTPPSSPIDMGEFMQATIDVQDALRFFLYDNYIVFLVVAAVAARLALWVWTLIARRT